MTSAEQQRVAGDEVLQQPGEPNTILLHPVQAPSELLKLVTVNEYGRSLDAMTSLGLISAELYWGPEKDGRDDNRASFYSALDPDFDPSAANNPEATHVNPYATLPFEAFYSLAVRVPLAEVDHEWSAEKSDHLGYRQGFFKQCTMLLSEFRIKFPDVEVDLPDGEYEITMKYQEKSSIAIAARLEDGEPLVRRQIITEIDQQPIAADDIEGDLAALEGGSDLDAELTDIDVTTIEEIYHGEFMRSELRPDTAVSLLSGRVTINTEDVDVGGSQRLRFARHDGYSRTGIQDSKRGVVEIIVYKVTDINILGFTFKEPLSIKVVNALVGEKVGRTPVALAFEKGPTRMSVADEPELAGEGLEGGETRFSEPKTVEIHLGAMANPVPIAAFRFALAAKKEAA